MNRKLILGVLAGLVVLCTIASVAVGLWGTSLWQRVSEEPEGVLAEVAAPESATLGQTFVIRVSVQNLTAEALVLDSIDVAQGYLAGIDILGADPTFSESFPLPFGGVQSYTFERDIPANQTLMMIPTLSQSSDTMPTITKRTLANQSNSVLMIRFMEESTLQKIVTLTLLSMLSLSGHLSIGLTLWAIT